MEEDVSWIPMREPSVDWVLSGRGAMLMLLFVLLVRGELANAVQTEEVSLGKICQAPGCSCETQNEPLMQELRITLK